MPPRARKGLHRTVLKQIPKGRDLELVISLLKLEDHVALELRDYIPSTQKFGRGVTIPGDEHTALAVGEALMRIASNPSVWS